MNIRISLPLLLALLTGGLTAAPAVAQIAPDPNAPAVTLTVKPATIPINGTVTIAGVGYPQPGVQIVVTITSPSGAATTLNTVPDNNGNYHVVFSKTPVEGTYTVGATFGAKGAPAKGSFTAQNKLIDIDEDVTDNKALLDESKGFVDAVKKAVEDLPPSPARDQMDAKLGALDAQLEEVDQQSSALTSLLGNFKAVMSQRPDAQPVLQPFYDHLAELDAETKDEKSAAAKQIEASAKDLKTCDAIDHATVALKAVPELIAIVKKPFDFAIGFATSIAKGSMPDGGSGLITAASKTSKLATSLAGKDTDDAAQESLAENEMEMGSEPEIAEKLVDHIPESVRTTDAYKFVVKEIRTRLPGMVTGVKSPVSAFNAATKIAGDVVAYANEQLFAKYCQKFEGHFTATMLAHFFSKPTPESLTIEWWTFSEAISGKLTLRYPKDASGKAVDLSGQFEGGATKFTYKEDVFSHNLFGNMVKGGTVYLKDAAPVPMDDASGGITNDLTSPTSFMIPVTGQFADGKITLTMGEAREDFNLDFVKAHTFYVVIAPTTLGLPVMGHFSLPYMPARFILDHLKADLPVTTSGTTMTAKHVESKDLPGPQNKATYTINLKICNPGCGG